MSKYANYDVISKGYDENRSAVSSHLVVGAFLTQVRKPLAEQHLLDAGCGTGNYALAMLQAGVGKVTLFDASEGMLEKAKVKCEEYSRAGRVEVRQGVLPNIPYPDGYFDSVMLNHVIHHLDLDSAEDRPNMRKTLAEAYRVIKPGGLCVLQESFPNQMKKAVWWYHLSPRTLEYFLKICPGRTELCNSLAEAGFSDVEIIAPTNTLCFPTGLYFDEDGPIRDEVRRCDSFWDKVPADEMATILDRIRSMKEAGTMKDFMLDHDKERTEVGQFSIVFAKRQ